MIDTRRIRDFGRGPFLPRRNNDREKKSQYLTRLSHRSVREALAPLRERERNEGVVVVGAGGGGSEER